MSRATLRCVPRRAKNNNNQQTNTKQTPNHLQVLRGLGHGLELGDRAAAARPWRQAQERALRGVLHRLAREALGHQAPEAPVRGVLVEEMLDHGARDDVADVVRAAAHVFAKRDAFCFVCFRLVLGEGFFFPC